MPRGRAKSTVAPSTLAAVEPRRPPTVYVPAADDGRAEAYVRLPLSPEVVEALREHAENGARLFELFTGKSAATVEVLDAIRKTASALERDVAKVRARLKKRRRRR